MSQHGTKSPHCALGRAGPLRPGRSDIDFLADLEGVVDFDAKITHRAILEWPSKSWTARWLPVRR
jgi:hypothetical protein